MEVQFESSFEKDLGKIKDEKLQKSVKEVIKQAKEAKDLTEIKNINKLKGYKTFYRIRIGDYRIGLDIINGKVIFVRILNRKDIYKYFP